MLTYNKPKLLFVMLDITNIIQNQASDETILQSDEKASGNLNAVQFKKTL